MRWFAEAAWYPTALPPSQGVHGEAVDERSARATVTDGPLSLSLLFGVDDAGHIRSFRAGARGRQEGRTTVMAPWEGSWSDHRSHRGMRLPFTGEVAWRQPDGRQPYVIGHVTALSLAFSPWARTAAADATICSPSNRRIGPSRLQAGCEARASARPGQGDAGLHDSRRGTS